MTTPQFRNTLQVTSHAVQLLDDAVAGCHKIRSTVDEAVQKLVGQGMVSLSGQSYGNAVERWINDFNTITNNLGAMSTTLKNTGNTIQKNEDNLSQLPTQITSLLSS